MSSRDSIKRASWLVREPEKAIFDASRMAPLIKDLDAARQVCLAPFAPHTHEVRRVL
jgi:hypothetical protein